MENVLQVHTRFTKGQQQKYMMNMLQRDKKKTKHNSSHSIVQMWKNFICYKLW